jgi:hypothetical protein
MYVWRNIEARTYSECVFVALGIQHEMPMRHIVICGPSGPTTLLDIKCLFVKKLQKIFFTKILFVKNSNSKKN